MKNLTSRVSDDDLENARLNRDSALNPPDAEPGMEDDDGWGSIDTSDGDDGWGASSGFDEPSIGGGFGSGLDSGGFGGGFNRGGFGPPGMGMSGMGMQGMQQPQENPEDKFWNAVAKGGKGSFNFISELVKSFKTFDTPKRMVWGRNVIFTGLGIMLATVISLFFGVHNVMNVIIGSLLAVGVGVPVFMVAMDDIKSGKYQPSQPVQTFDTVAADDDDEFVIEDDTEEDEEDTETEQLFGNLVDDEEEEVNFPSAFNDFDEEEEEVVAVNPTEVLDKLNANMGMITRQYLYETVNSCLLNKNKSFDKVTVLPEDSREFLAFCAIIEKAAENLKTGNQETMPQLLVAKDKLFYTMLEISRVKWIKNIQPFIEEIVNMCRFDEATGKIDETVFGIGYVVGEKIYIKVMKGETAIVTVKDAYGRVKDNILDSANYMPVVFGIDEEGEVVWQDLKKINSMLVTGMPRSGKSWFIKAILAQMMFFLKPSELNFYLLDPKGDISDFKSMNVPHIKKFVSSDEDIVRELRWVVKTEADRRRRIMKEAGNFIDFWDLKRKRPDIELPLLYVVIDEVVTLAERMDNETKKEFQGLLTQLVSQLPALGIRIFMVPHVVKDQVLKKTITDLIPCRISVCGDAAHIESTTGTTPKDFVHKLSNQGDMAVRLGNSKTQFVHGAVLADTNEGHEDFFDFLTKFWLKMEPSSLEGSKYAAEQLGEGRVQKATNAPKLNISAKAPVKSSNANTATKLSDTDMKNLLKDIHTKPSIVEEEDENEELDYGDEEIDFESETDEDEDEDAEIKLWGDN